MCIVFESTLSDNTRHDFSGHNKKHQVEIEEKLKLVPGSELRKKFVVKKKIDKISFLREVVKVWQCSKHSRKLPLYWLKRINLFSDGEDILKHHLNKITKWVGDKVLKER